tara:strand:+ start:820 stop:951 length:132 start_codon:yes stop_codon:yes gene_type:complete
LKKLQEIDQGHADHLKALEDKRTEDLKKLSLQDGAHDEKLKKL